MRICPPSACLASVQQGQIGTIEHPKRAKYFDAHCTRRAHRARNPQVDDIVSIDVEARSLEVDADLESRRAEWTAPESSYKSGAMAKYAYLVASASEGAVTCRPDLSAGPMGSA